MLSIGQSTATASVKVQQCRAEDCAKLAFKNVQKAAVNLGKYADDIENLEMAATHIKDSGLPKSFVDAVPKLDAVVAVVDQFADVSLRISLPVHPVEPWLVPSISEACLERDDSSLQGTGTISFILCNPSSLPRSLRA